jgi:MFS family permease
MDGGFYLILTAVPLRAIDLHASPLQLGILPLLGSGVYVGAALLFGSLSDRFPRTTMARLGAVLRAGVSLGLTRPHSIAGLMAWMPLLGVANGLFWPALQAAIGDLEPERRLHAKLGWFNISWSTGKMLGFVVGGAVIAAGGYDAALLLATGVTILVALGVPALPRKRPGPEATSLAPELPRPGWRGIGWLANFVLFGVGATLNYQYPKLMTSIGFTGRDFGVYLGAIYFFQTFTFAILGRWGGWHFRLWPLLAAQGAALVSVAALGWLRSLPAIWATAPWIGLGLGMSYSSSIYYSLFRQSGPGRSTGIHEALLGTGTFLLPLLGGGAASLTGNLIAPYLLCGFVLLLGMGTEIALASRSRR